MKTAQAGPDASPRPVRRRGAARWPPGETALEIALPCSRGSSWGPRHASPIARGLPGLETKMPTAAARTAPSLQRDFNLTRIGPLPVGRRAAPRRQMGRRVWTQRDTPSRFPFACRGGEADSEGRDGRQSEIEAAGERSARADVRTSCGPASHAPVRNPRGQSHRFRAAVSRGGLAALLRRNWINASSPHVSPPRASTRQPDRRSTVR